MSLTKTTGHIISKKHSKFTLELFESVVSSHSSHIIPVTTTCDNSKRIKTAAAMVLLFFSEITVLLKSHQNKFLSSKGAICQNLCPRQFPRVPAGCQRLNAGVKVFIFCSVQIWRQMEVRDNQPTLTANKYTTLKHRAASCKLWIKTETPRLLD